MATIVNRRPHALECNGVMLKPGENTIDDDAWSKASTPGSQLDTWRDLGWIAERRDKQAGAAPRQGASFHAPSVDSPVSQEPGSDMNPAGRSSGPLPSGATASGATATTDEGDESKRIRRPGR